MSPFPATVIQIPSEETISEYIGLENESISECLGFKKDAVSYLHSSAIENWVLDSDSNFDFGELFTLVQGDQSYCPP